MIRLATDGLDSPRTVRNYRMALNDFFNWHETVGSPMLSKALIQRFKSHLQDKGLAPSTINLKLSAVRKLVSELADNGVIDPVMANGISRVKGVKNEGVRMGNWLSLAQAQALLDAPDIRTVKGLRDRAILALLVGCALTPGGMRRLAGGTYPAARGTLGDRRSDRQAGQGPSPCPCRPG